MTARNLHWRLVALVLVGGLLTVGGAAAAYKWLPRDSQLHFSLINLIGRPLDPAGLGAGGPALRVVLGDPVGLAVSPDGVVYLADRGREALGHVVWRFTVDGRAEVVAGTGRKGRPTFGAAASASDLASPENLAFDLRGRLLIVDSLNHVVVAIEHDGTLSLVAGTSTAGNDGDGGAAVAAKLDHPYDVKVGPSGQIYIADFGNNKIRVIDGEGTIRTLAGDGFPGYSGDGGPAVDARLNGPYGVLPLADGSVLIADSGNHVVRQVSPDGTISTVVGTGERGYAGDGGLACDALFDSPQSLAIAPDGLLLVNDEHNRVVRSIDGLGVVGTIGREGGATGSFDDPENVAVLPDGTLVVAVGDEARVLRIVMGGGSSVLAGIGRSVEGTR